MVQAYNKGHDLPQSVFYSISIIRKLQMKLDVKLNTKFSKDIPTKSSHQSMNIK